MATFLDIGLLQKFDIIFPFLFVFVLIWGVLSYSQFLGDQKWVHSFAALILGLLVLVSASAREVINQLAPWFVLFAVFALFMLIFFKMFGFSDSDILTGLRGDQSWVLWTIGILFTAIFVYSIINVNVWEKEDAGEETNMDGDVGEGGAKGFFATLRHPKVLGLILILIISSFAISNLSRAT